MDQQRVDVEKEFENIAKMKLTKGRTAAVFKTFDKIRGKSKDGPELVAMKNPETDEFIFSPDELKAVSIKYCVNLLQNKKVDPEYSDEIEYENLLHYLRIKDDCKEDQELYREDFENRLKEIEAKSGGKYKFLLRSGNGFKNCVFRLFNQIWKEEEKPQQWRNTVIIQLYKGKGETCDFNNQRNIHTKKDIPKLFEGIVVDKSKPKLIEKCSKFQIGGIPKHRSQEHLFTVKSVLALYFQLNLPVILQLFDISKYFDKEILKDAMDTLYSSGIRGKLYRLWYELYKDAQIKVKTGAGMTNSEATGENVAQGSIGGAILSSCNLDKTVTNYFAGSTAEISYATSRLQPILFQDDTIRLVTSIEDAQKGNIVINAAMKRKQLELNVAKCGVIIFDKKQRAKQTRDAINTNSLLTIGKDKVKAKAQDKYLGDILSEGGLRSSVEATISDRYGKAFAAIKEIGAVINDFRIDSLGGMKAGMEIFEMVVIPSVLNNCDTLV